MLIEFSVENFRSIKEPVSLSMIANNYIKKNIKNTFSAENYNLLKAAAIYGANASGKSNVLNAMRYAGMFIVNSSKESQAEEATDVEPFLLSTETEKAPSTFEFIILQDNQKYRYGFSLTDEKIIDEWLYRATRNKEETLFERHLQVIEVKNAFKEGKDLKEKTRENALFLSVVANFNGEIATSLINWIAKKFAVFVDHQISDFITTNLLKDQEFKTKFMKILKEFDVFIEDIRLVPTDIENYPSFIQKDIRKELKAGNRIVLPTETKTLHKKFNSNNKFDSMVEFDMDEQESEGTKRLFAILGPILDILEDGSVLAIDEVEIKLHPLIVEFLIKLFNSKRHNKNNAQLIFTTHDINILNNSLLRKDQIWFTSKNKYGATDLYSLNDYKDVRNCDATFNKDYLSGKYGGIPLLNTFDFFEEDCKEGM